jgi:hypothetical protein
MAGIGEYVPGSKEAGKEAGPVDTRGRPRPPEPLVVSVDRGRATSRCLRCGRQCGRVRSFKRVLHDLGDREVGRPRQLHVTYSQHHCTACRRYFSVSLSDLAEPKGRYTRRVVRLAVRLVAEDGLAYRAAEWQLWRDHRVFVPFATVQNWAEAAGGKSGDATRRAARRRVETLQRLRHVRRAARGAARAKKGHLGRR